jgi:hypothetical protein
MPCITTSTTLPVETLDDGSATIYFVVVSSQNPVTITFTCNGTINSVGVSPSPPRPASNSVTFTTDYLDQTFTVTIQYTPPTLDEDRIVHPLDTPTKLPKFKPVVTCPS